MAGYEAPKALARAPLTLPNNQAVPLAGSIRTVSPQRGRLTELILMAGDSYTGKDYAAMVAAERIGNNARAAGIQPPTFYVLDAEGGRGYAKLIGETCEFEHLWYEEEHGNVQVYPAADWTEVISAWRTIQAAAKQGDWIVVSPINRCYDYAQKAVADGLGKSLDVEKMLRAKQGQGFGAFDQDGWNTVKPTFAALIDPLTHHPRANVLLNAHTTQIVNVVGRERQDVALLFDGLPFKPQGPKVVIENVDSIMMLYAIRAFETASATSKQITGGKTLRYFTIVKDRGHGVSRYKEPFNDDPILQLQQWRERVRQERLAEGKRGIDNIIDPEEAARLIEENEAKFAKKAIPPEALEEQAVADS